MSIGSVSGIPVSPGIAIGQPVVHRTRPISALRISVPTERLEDEVRRFHEAVQTTVEAIEANSNRAREVMGEEFAAVLEAHRLIAADPGLAERVERFIREHRVNADWAFEQVVGEYLQQFEKLGDAYLEERRLDLLDVAQQILGSLRGYNLQTLADLDRPVVLVADDLPPSQVVQLPLGNILGFVLETGGATSHTTIIARSLGIPAVVGAYGAVDAAVDAQDIVVDAFEGRVVFDPDPAELEEYRSRLAEYEEQRAHLIQVAAEPSVTRDGKRIQLLANVDLVPETEEALRWGADGVGLYRSEFLYMKAAPALPSEEEHVRLYRELVRRVEGRPVTIRTFDLGGKKLAAEVIGSQEANPVLGLRGIRLCLRQRDFFRTQLRGILRVCGEFPPGQVRIMIPLVSGIEEVHLTRRIVRELIEELRSEGFPVHSTVPLGAMVEVPSAAVLADKLVTEVDFLSIGTNDLVQYTLAVDRANELVADLFSASHPAILRLIDHVIRSAAAAGIELSMCGEAAADPIMVPVLVGLGLTKLSMNPQALPVVRKLIRHLSVREAAQIARTALRMSTTREVQEFLLERLAILFAKIKIHV